MATPSTQTKTTAVSKTPLKMGKILAAPVTDVPEGPVGQLGEIFKMLKIMDEDRRLNQEMANAYVEEQEHQKNRRNQEIIKALTGRKKKPKPKIKKEKTEQPRDEKGRFVKREEPAAVTPTPPAPPAPKPPVVERVAEVAKSAVEKVKQVAPGVTTAAKVGAPAIMGAAAISILGETGAKTADAAVQKGGQIVPNDPKPGVTSYGIFGMNSAAGTASQFAAMNPQFNMTGKPGSKEFDTQWKQAFESNPKAFFDAQLAWYDKVILQPLRNDLKKLIDPSIASDERVVGYMADRRIQYGKTMEKTALSNVAHVKTAEQFIDKMTEFDLANIGTAFSTYLQNHPNNKGGLEKRIKTRKEKSLALPQTPGDSLAHSSTQNADLKKEMNTVPQVNSQSITTIQNNQTNQLPSAPKANDRNPMLEKGRQ